MSRKPSQNRLQRTDGRRVWMRVLWLPVVAWVLSLLTACTELVSADANQCLGPVCSEVLTTDSNAQIVLKNSGISLRTVHLYFDVQGADIEYLVSDRFALPAESETVVARITPNGGPWSARPLFAHNHGAPLESLKTQGYQVPIPPSEVYELTQQPGAAVGHSSWERNAYDFAVPVGTTILASRDGRVIEAIDRFVGQCREPTDTCRRTANRIVIQHDDGGLALYVHLEHNSVRVKVGETVKAGDWIASSGNTGFSSGPHLHFEVAGINLDLKRESVAVEFADAR